MIDLRKVDQASKMAARWLVKTSQVSGASDPNLGAFRAEYDLAHGKVILGRDVWHTSEAIRALLKIHARTGNRAWKHSALLGGRYLESIQCRPEEGDEAGSLWRPWLQGSEALSVSMNYRAILGLLDLYAATGALRYLDSAKAIADWFLRRVYRGGGTHLDRFLPDKKAFGWPRTHILDEGSFLMLHDLTREDRYARIFQDQIESLASSLEPQGTFSCMHTPRMEKDPDLATGEVSSRAMYWHLAPMLVAQLKRRAGRAADALKAGAALMREMQAPEGFLPRVCSVEGKDEAGPEPDGVATAMFALIWMRMAEICGDQDYLQSAEDALSWMLRSQLVARRDPGAFGAFFQERKLHGGEPQNYLGGVGSIYGVLACEDYIRLHAGR